MTAPFSIPFSRLLTRFEYTSSEGFVSGTQRLRTLYTDVLLRDYSAKETPSGLRAPKISFSPTDLKPDSTLSVDPINAQNTRFEVENGRITGKLESWRQWEPFQYLFDKLISCYEDVFRPQAREFVVQTHAILLLSDRKNYDIVSRLIPDLRSQQDIFSSIAMNRPAHIQRTDLACTFLVPKCEIVIDLEAPANDDHSMLWVTLTYRTPQEEIAAPEFFRLSSITDFLRAGDDVLAKLVDGITYEVDGVRSEP